MPTAGAPKRGDPVMQHWAAAAVLLVVGVPVGSFLNVVVDRTPERLPLRGGRPTEPVSPVSWAGVPAQPWLLRRAADRSEAPDRWLHVELLTALCLAAVGLRYGLSLRTLPLLVLAAALVAVSVVDLQLLRIPDRITFPALGVTAVLVVVSSVADDATRSLHGALVGAVAYFGFLLLPHLVYPKGMGFGDVKLALVMGLHLGWVGWTASEPTLEPIRMVLYALVLGCALGVVFGAVVGIATRQRGAFPFGPALALACLAVVIWSG